MKKEINTKDLNEVIKISKRILKIIYIITIILIITLLTKIFKDWHIFSFIKSLLIVISPIFIGFIIAWLVDPIINKMSKKNIKRPIAVVIVYLIILLVLTIGLLFLVPTLVNQIKIFIDSFPSTINDIKNFTNNLLSNSNFDTEQVKKDIYENFAKLNTSITTSIPTHLFNFGKSIFTIISNLVLGLMLAFYLSLSFDKVKRKIKNSMPNSWKENYEELMKRINTTLRGYVGGVLLIMLLVFITQSIGLTLAGLKAPLIFALFCALTDIIPYFGPWIGGIPAIIVGFTISPTVGLFTLLAILIVQILENYFYQPLIMGKTMSMSPITIMIGLLVFGHFFGLIGMIVATPVIATFKIIYEFINEKVNIKEKLLKIK